MALKSSNTIITNNLAMKMSKSFKDSPCSSWHHGTYIHLFRRPSGIELAIKYMKKFDYFVPCYYDLKKKHFSKDN